MSTVGGGVNIVKNGLVLYLDASNTKSYVSGSTAWNDVSKSGNNGVLTNGPTFNSANGGSIVFDGVDDYVKVSDGYSNIMKNNNNWCVSFWFKANSVSNSPILLSPEIGQLNYFDLFLEVGTNAIYFAAGGGAVSNYLSNTTVSLTANKFYNIFFIKTGTSTGKVYLNGSEITMTTVGSGLGSMPNSNADFRIGSFKVAGYYLNGNIYNVSMYNRTLTSDEVSQNFNATRTRFGI